MYSDKNLVYIFTILEAIEKINIYSKDFYNIVGLWNYLEELYHKKIDLIHFYKRANKIIINNIKNEVIYG